MITVKPLRDEAIKVGFASILDRLPHGFSFEEFKGAMASWDVKAFHDGEKTVGMLMTRGPELHVAVLPEVRGRWLSKRLIREVFSPIFAEYGYAVSAVMPDNEKGIEFTQRLGFDGDLQTLRVGFETLKFDPVTAAIGVGGALLGSTIQAGGATSAAGTAANASHEAVALQQAIYNQQRADLEPWRQSGQNALTNITQSMPYFNHQFNASDLNANLAPNYQFQLEQGQGAAKNALNLTGGLNGNFGKGLVDYTVNKAGDAYQQAFNNYSTNQSNIFNRLSTIAGFGSGANQISAGLAGQISPGIASATQNAGAAQAAGTVGAANAAAGGINNALGWYSLSNLMNQGGGTSYSDLASTPFNNSDNYG